MTLGHDSTEAKRRKTKEPPRPASKAMDPKALPDGLMVHGGLQLRSLEANWVILITLEEPVYPEGLIQHIEHVSTSMAPLYQKFSISPLIRDAWLDRLERIRGKESSRSRRKRGILNLGGSLLNTLFGVATEGQLQKYSKAVQSLSQRTSAIMHVVPELMTVVNQSRMYVKENREQLRTLTGHQQVVEQYLQNMSNRLADMELRLGAAELRLEMDRVISALETVYDLYQQDMRRHQEQRIALETGRLSEDLLSRTTLLSILETIRATGYNYIETLEWFYQYLTVQPVWQNDENLLFRIVLPLIDQTPSLLYHVRSFPSPLPNSNVTASFDLNEFYGYNTEEDGLFRARFCVGENPKVCQRGAMFEAKGQRCINGVINARIRPIKSCKIKFKMNENNVTQIFQLEVNDYVISTWGSV